MTLTYLILFALFMFLIIFTPHYLHRFYNLHARFAHIFTLGCLFSFLGKSKYGFVISAQWILQRQKNAKSEKGLFHDKATKQTQIGVQFHKQNKKS